jgi:hypothetical protein
LFFFFYTVNKITATAAVEESVVETAPAEIQQKPQRRPLGGQRGSQFQGWFR